MENSHRFFNNHDCKYFPCHTTSGEDKFNCLFCFCPLYFLEGDCGGNYEMSEKNVKLCMNCKLPHQPEYYDVIIDKLKKA